MTSRATQPETLDRVALLALMERVRVNLLRARFHKQQAELHKKRLDNRSSSYHKGRFNHHTEFAKVYRHHARRDLEKWFGVWTQTASSGVVAPGLRLRSLGGSTFTSWTSYVLERNNFGGDTWLEEYDARRKPK